MIKQYGLGINNFSFMTFGFGDSTAVYTPVTLFSAGQQGALYDPSDLTTLWQDAAGTVPVTKSGDPVGLMKDRSGNGYHAKQTVSASRPTYQTDGILHKLMFDGVDDWLLVNNQTWLDNSTHKAFFSLAYKASGLVGYVFHNSTIATGTAQNGLLYNDSGFDSVRSGGNTTPVRYATSTAGVVLAYKYDLSNLASSYYKNGSALSGSVIAGVAGSTITIGCRTPASPAVFCRFDFYGMTIVNDYVTDNAMNSTQQYLATKAGVTL